MTKTKKTSRTKIVSALRRVWLYSVERQQALQAGRVSKGQYQCAACHQLFKAKEIQVDHIFEVAAYKNDWHQYITRLFCPPEQLQCLCKPCHQKKTNENTNHSL